MIKNVLAVALLLVSLTGQIVTAGGIQKMVFAETPRSIVTDLPHLAKVPYQTKTWRGWLDFPVLGKKESVIRYFEFPLKANEIISGATGVAITNIEAFANGMLEITIITQANPPQYALANEAVNALLPQWLMDAGIDMYVLYNQESGNRHKFTWDGKIWSFNQLSEALSDIVGSQVIPGGYMSVAAPRMVCRNIANAIVNPGEEAYLFTKYLVKKSECNLAKMYEYSGEALKSFMRTAPKIR